MLKIKVVMTPKVYSLRFTDSITIVIFVLTYLSY